jgi:hypothetical protein
MICSICSLIITKDNSIITDNKVFCIQCNDINDFAKDIEKDKIILEKKEEIIEKKEIKNFIKCPKCKNKFSTKKCNCGYINPL